MVPGAGGDVNTTLPLILNIVAAILCCGIGSIVAIVGIVFAVQAGTAKNNGDIETARKKAKLSLILAVVGAVTSIILGIVYWIIVGAANFAS